MASPSTRPWLGVGVALSALPAAGGCFCVALLLAVIADSDPGAVYEQHRWLGVVVAAGAVCAFAAMMGWATLRHGGVPAPVLLMALVVAAVPFALPGGLFLPGAATALAASAALAWAGLARPPASLHLQRRLSGGLALTALTLAIGQAIVVGLHDRPSRPRAAVDSSLPHSVAAEPAATAAPRRPDPGAASASEDSAAAPPAPAHATAPKAAPPLTAPPTTAPRATAPPTEAPHAITPSATAPRATAPSKEAPHATAPSATAPETTAPINEAPHATAPSASAPRATAPSTEAPRAVAPPATALPSSPQRFVRDYYAALQARRFAAAWKLLAPGLQARFGGFSAWRSGYKYTVTNSPGALRVTPAAGAATVGLTLRAGDRDACGRTVVRRFAVTWRLARTEAGWRATAAHARKVSGAQPAAAC